MNEFNENNPMFIAYVELLNALYEEGILQKNPDNPNHILIYRNNVDASVCGVSEGWFTMSIFDVAQELFSKESNRTNLYETLAERGLKPQYNENGDFDKLVSTDIIKSDDKER